MFFVCVCVFFRKFYLNNFFWMVFKTALKKREEGEISVWWVRDGERGERERVRLRCTMKQEEGKKKDHEGQLQSFERFMRFFFVGGWEKIVFFFWF